MPRIPLIEDLTKEPVPDGDQLLVEFDPGSQWYNASTYMAAGWLKTGGKVAYNVYAQPPDQIRRQLKRLGLNTEELERDDKLRVLDWYTATLGQKSKEKIVYSDSLKVADISLNVLKEMSRPPSPEFLTMSDNNSILARFNEEKTWIELQLTRIIPKGRQTMERTIRGVMTETHSVWAYKQLEGAVDGIIDFKLETSEKVGEQARSLLRIRLMQNVGFDGRWHPLKMNDNCEITLEE